MVQGKWARSWREYGLGHAWHVQEGLIARFTGFIAYATAPGGIGVMTNDKGGGTIIFGEGTIINEVIVRDEAYQALLGHFGLEQWKEEFPPEKIINISPAKLAAARREKERLCGLERRKMMSGTLGDYRPAEEFE